MSEDDKFFFAGAAVVAVFLATSITVWPFVTQTQVGTPKGGAHLATAPDAAPRGGSAQRAADSTVEK